MNNIVQERIRSISNEIYKASLRSGNADLMKQVSPFLLSSSIALTNGADSVKYNFLGSARNNPLEQPSISQNDVLIGVYHALQYKLSTAGTLSNSVASLETGNVSTKFFFQAQMEMKAGNASIFEGLDTQVLEASFDHEGIVEAGDAFRALAVPFVVSGEGELNSRIDLPSFATKTFSVEADGAVPAANQMYLVHQIWGLRVRNFTYTAGVKNWSTVQEFLDAVAGRY